MNSTAKVDTDHASDPARSKQITISINDQQFKVTEAAMTGAALKALSGISAANQLFQDAPGNHDDPQVLDDVPYDIKNGMKFYDVPVGNFGAN